MSWPKGKPRSKDTKRKISRWLRENGNPMTGHHHSGETKQRISQAMSQTLQGNKRRLGIPHTEETKQRIGKASRAQWASRVDRHQTAEHIKHNADARCGGHLSEETRKRMREVHKTRLPHSEETRRKMSESSLGVLNPMFGKQHSEETKKKIGDAARGDKNPRWRSGISTLPYPFTFNRELKERIRERDGYRCRLCGALQAECTQKLSIHHIDYDKDNLADENLISLCRRCNSRVNKNRVYWQQYFSEV